MSKTDSDSKLTELALHPTLVGCFRFIENVLGYQLSEKDKEPFIFYHHFLTNPEPAFSIEWRSDPKRMKWRDKFSNVMLGDVQNALACVLYHHGRLCGLEKLLHAGLDSIDFSKLFDENMGSGGGNSLTFDFEYQAYVLAFRRCLDYLARAIGAYFIQDYQSFNSLAKKLKKINRPAVTDRIIEVHEKYCPHFEFVLSTGDRKSVRDNISHRGYVPFGVVNINRQGVFIASDMIDPIAFYGREYPLLSVLLNQQIDNLRNCLHDTVHAYVDGIKQEEGAV